MPREHDEEGDKAGAAPTLTAAAADPPAGSESVAVSADGRFLFVCSEAHGGIVRVGAGLASLSSTYHTPSEEGRVYAQCQLPLPAHARQQQQQLLLPPVLRAKWSSRRRRGCLANSASASSYSY